nr:NUDIX domain-containing protein [Halobacillus locisalis]
MTFNENEEPLQPKGRSLVHRDGDWHETFHCWFYEVSEKGTFLYFQKRAEDKADFPKLFDITAAGHIEVGEKVMDAGVREIEEEVGLSIDHDQMETLGTYKEELLFEDLKDREICRVFLYRIDQSGSLQVSSEVSDIIRVRLVDVPFLKNDPVKYQSVITGEEGDMTFQDVVPHSWGYIQFIIQHVMEKVEKL